MKNRDFAIDASAMEKWTAFQRAGRHQAQFHVRPRYTPGSPALVLDTVAMKVAVEEKAAYERALTGVMGEREKRKAEVLGLSGIAYAMYEKGSGKKFRWHVFDLITYEETRRLHETQLREQGYVKIGDLPEWARKEVCETGVESDYDRAWFDYVGRARPVLYKPEIVRGP